MFLFIFGMNSLGFFTYTFPITTHIFVTFGLALGIWLGVIILGFYNFRGMFLSYFNPSGAVETNCSGDETCCEFDGGPYLNGHFRRLWL